MEPKDLKYLKDFKDPQKAHEMLMMLSELEELDREQFIHAIGVLEGMVIAVKYMKGDMDSPRPPLTPIKGGKE